MCCKAKACMEVSPCGHQSQCRLCFVHTIQDAVACRDLPLKCLVCRTKILRVKNASRKNNPHFDHPVHPAISRGMQPSTSTTKLSKSASRYSFQTGVVQPKKNMACSISSYSISSGKSMHKDRT